MRPLRFRWKAPGGLNQGAARRTREEAMVEAIAIGQRRSIRGLDADLVLQIWPELEAAGWSIEEVRL